MQNENNVIEFQKVLAINFNNQELLSEALTHSSYANENQNFGLSSNERMEYLGDAVLGLVVGEDVFLKYSDLTEGDMTKLRAYLVKQDTLAIVAKRLELGSYLSLGKGEEISGGREKKANLARAFEAVIAAIYLDQGLEVVRKFIWKLIKSDMEYAINNGVISDYKSRLQEFVQSTSSVPPTYHLIEQTGPDHDRTFTVEVRSDDKVLAKGIGKTKKSAETEAAKLALKSMKGDS